MTNLDFIQVSVLVSAGNVEVIYSGDLDASFYGSGFPPVCDQKPESVDANVWNDLIL